MGQNAFFYECAEGLITAVILLVAEFCPPEKRHIIKAAKDFVATNYPVSVSVEDIAAAANVSRTTLFRIFKSELNTTPVEFLTAYRIAQAKTLLTETELSITAVARSSGYEDNLYFSRVFRKITGFTPTEYRNCNKNPYE